MIKSHDAPKKSRFADEIEIGERYAEIEYNGGKVLQLWCGSGGNWNSWVMFAYLIYWWFLVKNAETVK